MLQEMGEIPIHICVLLETPAVRGSLKLAFLEVIRKRKIQKNSKFSLQLNKLVRLSPDL